MTPSSRIWTLFRAQIKVTVITQGLDNPQPIAIQGVPVSLGQRQTLLLRVLPQLEGVKPLHPGELIRVPSLAGKDRPSCPSVSRAVSRPRLEASPIPSRSTSSTGSMLCQDGNWHRHFPSHGCLCLEKTQPSILSLFFSTAPLFLFYPPLSILSPWEFVPVLLCKAGSWQQQQCLSQHLGSSLPCHNIDSGRDF